MSASNGKGHHPAPTDLPAWARTTPQAQAWESTPPAGNGTHVAPHAAEVSSAPAGGIDFLAQQELRDRVSTRLTAEGGAAFEALDAATQRLRKRTVAMEELQSWVLHRTSVGLPAVSLESEDALIEAVLASLGGLGRLEPLLLRSDVEDIFFHGTAATMLRLADGRKAPAGPIAGSNEELHNLLQQLASTLGDGTSREFSNPINPLIVEGQVHGGLAQGIAQALFEEAVFDESGNLTTGTFVDYTMPSAADLPSFTTDRTVSPSTDNPLGVKGVGEAGTIASTPAVVNAIVDALRPFGVNDIRMPATPERVWRAVHTSEGSRS